MSLELLTALAFVIGVGALVASIVGAVTCARRNPPQPPDDTPGAPPPSRTLAFGWDVCWPLRIWLAIMAGSVVLIILAFAGLLSVIGQEETNVLITEPDSGDVVDMELLVRGTSAHVPTGRQIWVVVQPHDEAIYYPQPEAVVVVDDDSGHDDWSARVLVGGPDDAGKAFDILAVLADADASDVLSAHRTTPASGVPGPALDVLPEGVTIYEQVTVARQ